MSDAGDKTRASGQIEQQSAELAAMRRMLAASRGTSSISVAICNSPALRNHLIERLTAETPGIVVLEVPEGTEDVYDFARAKAPDSPAAGLFVTGIEESVPSGLEHYPVLRRLNAARELWGQAFRCPVVFWLPEYAATLLSIHARDLWSWKSHQFEFVSELATATMGVLDRFAGDVDLAANLTADQKRFRIAELEQRIMEAGAPPKLELARHSGVWLNELGVLHLTLGEIRKAIECYEHGLAVAREVSDRYGEGATLGNLGSAYSYLGDTHKAIECYKQQLVIAREVGDRRGEGNALGNLGSAYAGLGEVHEAIGYYEQALVIDREIGNRYGEGATLGNLGVAHKEMGEVRKAIGYYEQALAIAREVGDRYGEGATLGNLGLAYKNMGEVRRAIEHYEQVLSIARQVGDRRVEGGTLWNMALVMDELGRRQEAIALAETALRIFREIEEPSAAKVERQLAEWRAGK